MISYIQKLKGVYDIMTDNLIYTTETNLYLQYENQSQSKINRRCIDGSLTGCGNCVGYCQYREHPGFLTQKQRAEHDCLNKQCHYYLPKPQRQRTEKSKDIGAFILSLAKRSVSNIDDLRIMNTRFEDRTWVIGYVTVFGQYNFSEVEQKIEKESGVPVIMQKLDYSFERCVELMCSRC